MKYDETCIYCILWWNYFHIYIFLTLFWTDRQTDRQTDIVVYREVTLPKIKQEKPEMDDFEEENKFGYKAKILQKFHYLKKYFEIFLLGRVSVFDEYPSKNVTKYCCGGGGRPPTPTPFSGCVHQECKFFFTCSLVLKYCNNHNISKIF